jgi:hypothetical protein
MRSRLAMRQNVQQVKKGAPGSMKGGPDGQVQER